VDARGGILLAAPNRDARGAGEGIRLATEYGEALNEATGHWPLPIFLASRLLWLRDQRPEEFARAKFAFSASDWLGWRLTGKAAADPTQAGETLLFDLAAREWSAEWCERLDLPFELLPEVREPGSALGRLRAEAATWLGLSEGTPVAVGIADTQAALIGCNALSNGQTTVVAGTTLPIQRATTRVAADPDARCWVGQHPLAGLQVIESNQGPVGEPLEWFAQLLHPASSCAVAAMFAEARSAEAGAHAALSTLGADVMNARERGLPFASLGFSHMALPEASASARGALSRAIVEGIAFGIRANLEQIETLDPSTSPEVHMSGGLSQSPTFTRIVAAALGAPVHVSATHESSALGAAVCAGVGAGCFPDLSSAAQSLVAAPSPCEASSAEAEAADEVYEAWQTQRAARKDADTTAALRSTGSMLRLARPLTPSAGSAPIRILATADLDAEALARLREWGEVEHASYRKMHRLLRGPALVEALKGFDVFLTEIDVLEADTIAAATDLRAVISCRGDAVNVDVAACTLHGIPVLNTPGRNADAVADLTVAFLLMLERHLAGASAFLRTGSIESGDMGKMGEAFNAFRGRELQARTIGLVGLGAVGHGVARRLRGFGARVLVADPYIDAETAAAAGAKLVSLEQLLEESDVTSLHAPVDDSTRNLIDSDAIARMKPGSGLINTARAALVDEDALAEALRSGHLGAAALDVFSVEPPGSDFPLLNTPNLIATPHVAGNTFEVAVHQGRIAADELDSLLGGRTPRFCLNAEVLADFDLDGERRQPSAQDLEKLREKPAPDVTDLQRDSRAKDTPEPGPQ